MAIIKCKMCGGNIEISAGKTFGTCEYCGSTMTLPKTDDDQRLSLFNRGTHLRRNGETVNLDYRSLFLHFENNSLTRRSAAQIRGAAPTISIRKTPFWKPAYGSANGAEKTPCTQSPS